MLHDASFASICLVDVVVLRPWGSPFFTLVKVNATIFTQLPAAGHRGAVEAYVAGASHRGLRQEDLAMLVDPWSDAERQAAFYRQIAQADEEYTAELEPLLATLQVPTHIVWGENDEWIPVDRAHRLHEAITHSTRELVPAAGRSVPVHERVRS